MAEQMQLKARVKGSSHSVVVLLIEVWGGAWNDLAVERDKWPFGDPKPGDEFTIAIQPKEQPNVKS